MDRKQSITNRRDAKGSPRLRSMFVQDGANMVQMLELFLTDLQEHGYRRASLDSAFRAVHSLKSEAAFLEYSGIHEKAHQLESQLQIFRDSSTRESDSVEEQQLQRLADQIRLVTDAVTARVSELGQSAEQSANESVDPVPELNRARPELFLGLNASEDDRALLRLSSSEVDIVREARQRGEYLYRLQCNVSESEQLSYARLFLVMNNLESVVTVVRTYPPASQLHDHDGGVFQALVTGTATDQELYEALNVDQVANLEIDQLDFDQLLEQADGPERSEVGLLSDKARITLNLSPRRYETLSLYSDELAFQLQDALAAMSKLKNVSKEVEQGVRAATTLAARVNETLLDTSLVPLSAVVEPLYRLVEDIGSRTGKEVRLLINGESERVFLPVADVLSGALFHLVRNSVDHGIETPEARGARGKTREATIGLDAKRLAGGSLQIVVSDDGNGVHEESIRAAAGELSPETGDAFELTVDDEGGDTYGSETDASKPGNAPAGETRADPHADLLTLMARPGLTTREKAGDFSGRGVGMDAVKHSIESLLGGEISIENRPGRGVSFVLTLPGSTRLVTVLVFESGAEEVAVPSCQVADTFPIERSRIGTDSNGEYFYRLPDGVVRLFVVGDESIPERDSDRRYGILLRVADRRGVVLADRLISEEVVVRTADERRQVYSKTLEREVQLFVPVKI